MSAATLEHIILSSPQTQSDWSRYFQLRWELLRKPWHQPIGSERDEYDPKYLHYDTKTKALHLMALDQDTLIGVGRIHLAQHSTAQIRYMAVISDRQRQKVGTKIIAALEARAIAWGAQQITLNARNDFMDFYTKINYQQAGLGETLFNSIMHTRMYKQIAGR